jgi:hypothetical protein
VNDNLPMLPQLRTSQELVNPTTDSWAEMLPQVAELARAICSTPFVPDSLRNNVAGTTAAILYNREIGLPPMTGLNAVHVIKGKVGISAEMMRAQVLAAGHDIWFEETNTSYCVISGQRAGSDRVTTVKYSETDAKTAGLFSNDNYKKNPRRMYQARATSELCALIFPDVIRGMVSSEELEAEAEAGDSIPVPAEGGTTVQRRPRARKTSPAALEAAAEVPLPGEPQTDGGAAVVASPSNAGGSSPAPSSPLPPLPGEDETSAAATAESDTGAAAAAQSADGELRVPAAPASTPAPPLPGEEDLPEPADDITDQQRKKLFALMAENGLKERDQQIGWMSKNLNRELTSRSQVNKDDAIKLIDLLESLEATPRPVSRGDLRLLAGLFKELQIADQQERLHIASSIIGRTPMKGDAPSAEGLTAREANVLLQALGRCKNRDQVEALVQMSEDQRAEAGEQDG